MPTIADKIDFAKTYLTNKEGRRWTLDGRDWIRESFWLPCDGFKLWRKADSDPCKQCQERIGDLVEHPGDNPTTTCECGGLKAEPIIVTVLNLERQDGKTFNSMALALCDIFRGRNKSVAALWASEDQGTTIFDEVYRAAIERAPRLASNCKIFGQPPQIYVDRTKSRFEVLAASDRSATGRTRTRILIDEARDIHAKIAMKLIPAVFAMSGIECPNGHVQLSADQAATAPANCDACGSRLVPWFGRIVITTSSGVLTGGEFDWCSELVDELRQHPHPNYHLFASEATLNPSKSTVIMHAISDVFGRLESTRSYTESEVGNKWTKKGAEYVTKSELKRVTDPSLKNTDTATAVPCVAYLDTSRVGEKTSLVVLASDPLSPDDGQWSRVAQVRLDYWIPEEQPNRVIDDQVIYRHLCSVLPLFTGLKAFRIDTRGSQWAVQLITQIKRDRSSWGRVTAAWQDVHFANTDAGWGFLQERILKATIRLQEDKHQAKEFAGVMVKAGANGPARVMDRDRRLCHRDITESLACCCYLAHQEQTRKSVGLAYIVKRRTAKELLATTRSGQRQVESGEMAGGHVFGGPESY